MCGVHAFSLCFFPSDRDTHNISARPAENPKFVGPTAALLRSPSAPAAAAAVVGGGGVEGDIEVGDKISSSDARI